MIIIAHIRFPLNYSLSNFANNQSVSFLAIRKIIFKWKLQNHHGYKRPVIITFVQVTYKKRDDGCLGQTFVVMETIHLC